MVGVRVEDRLPRPADSLRRADPLARLTCRCAIYTRKSTEAGLDREANSLQTQREVCSAYIRSQSHKGWIELNQAYDDGGQSGGTLQRPALQRLLADVELGRVDVVVIYKIDRLTRSLTDFVRLIDVFERYQVAFVSITQSFDTSDSMGRLVLNVLLTFAQFEREMLGDRLRDKFAAMRRRGKFTGGNTPFGYDKVDGRLVVNERDAAIIRDIYNRYPQAPSGNQLLKQLRKEGVTSRAHLCRTGRTVGGKTFSTGLLNRILTNPIYRGYVAYKDQWYPGEQEAIVTREQWDRVQAVRTERASLQLPNQPSTHLLLGLLWDEHGRRMRIHCSSPEAARLRRHYVSQRTKAGNRARIKLVHVVGDEIEALTKSALQALMTNREQMTLLLARSATYADQTVRMLRAGPRAARHICAMDGADLRRLFEALLARVEVTRTELRLFVRCAQVAAFLNWNGVGRFREEPGSRPGERASLELIRVSALLVREHKFFALPISQRDPSGSAPDPKLVALISRARRAQAAVLENRDQSMATLARHHGVGPSYFARLVRLNYLAPDILTSIIDGSQPRSLTSKELIYASLPLDWGQQRQLLGFT